MTTVNICNKPFKIVNAPDSDIMSKLIYLTSKCITEECQALRDIEAVEVGHGACGTVYQLSPEYALKINNRDMSGWRECRDGQIMEKLQGLPMTPTLYAYSQDNYYTLIQFINGATIGSLWNQSKSKNIQLNTTDYRGHLQEAVEFYNGALERGLTIKDTHTGNVMIDTEGKLWVVDVGLFEDYEEGCYVQSPADLLDHVEEVFTELLKVQIPYKVYEEYYDKCNHTKGTTFKNVDQPLSSVTPLFSPVPIVQHVEMPARALHDLMQDLFKKADEFQAFEEQIEPKELIPSVNWKPAPQVKAHQILKAMGATAQALENLYEPP